MEIFLVIIVGFTLLQLLVATSNFLFRQTLPHSTGDSGPLLSVLIPARNEEKNIGLLLDDLLNQPYQSIEVLVFNDQSTDRTAQIVEKYSVLDSRIHLFNSEGLPEGWTGKNHACDSLARQARGEFYLFLDADVRISGDIFSRAIAGLQKQASQLLTIFPQQEMKSGGEWLVVPMMNYILLTLLPLGLVRRTGFASLAAANGQFMLFEAAAYKEFSPHKTVKNKRVEDIEIARYLKQNKAGVTCLAGNRNIRCRMYQNYDDALNGLSRSVLLFFGNSAFLAVVFWMVSTFGFIVILISMSWQNSAVYLFLLLLIRIFVSLASGQAVLSNILWGFFQKLNLGIVIGKAIVARSKKSFEWKGRVVS